MQRLVGRTSAVLSKVAVCREKTFSCRPELLSELLCRWFSGSWADWAIRGKAGNIRSSQSFCHQLWLASKDSIGSLLARNSFWWRVFNSQLPSQAFWPVPLKSSKFVSAVDNEASTFADCLKILSMSSKTHFCFRPGSSAKFSFLYESECCFSPVDVHSGHFLAISSIIRHR